MEIVPNYAFVLSGALEAGAGMDIRIQRTRTNATYPLIEIGSSSRHNEFVQPGGILEDLATFFGGHYYPDQTKNSHFMRIQGYRSVEAAKAAEPKAPARKDEIFLFREWKEDTNPSNRLEIARLFKKIRSQNHYDGVDLGIYLRLIDDGNFLAGVFIVRGSLLDSRTQGESKKRVRISSKNRPLVEAIKQVYGGNLYSFRNPSGNWVHDLRIYHEASSQAFLQKAIPFQV